MNVTATTLPRRSRSESRALSCVVNVNSGAGPIFDSDASAFASWPPAGPTSPTVANTTSMATHDARGPPMLPLQLLLELVEDAPVRALRDDLLWARLDHPGFLEPDCVEAHGVGRVHDSPLAVGQRFHRLQGPVVAIGVAVVHEESRGPLGLERTYSRCFEEGTQGALGRDGVLPHEVTVGRHHAAEVLGPGTVGEGVDEHAADLLLLQFQRLWRKGHEAVNFSLGKERHGFGRRELHQLDILAGFQAHIGEHAGEEDMTTRIQRGY